MINPQRQQTALYISYDGLTDPLGRSQILPYLLGCARRGHKIVALTAEKPHRLSAEGAAVAHVCAETGIQWEPIRYHKRPPLVSTVVDLAAIRRAAVALHHRHCFSLVHCRSYVPAAAGLHLKRRFGLPLLFDMRGFWPDEKAEGMSWNMTNPLFQLVYRHFKGLEAKLLHTSDAIVVLTEAAKAELRKTYTIDADQRISVIPCCVDFAHFPLITGSSRKQARHMLGIAEEASVLAYVGSLGGNYMLREMLQFYSVFRRKHASSRFLFITLDDLGTIHQVAAAEGIPLDELVIRSASRAEVPVLLAAADIGIAFKQPRYSARGCSPTKIGEMLAMGLPVVANVGVGDVCEVLASTAGGALVHSFDRSTFEAAIVQIRSLVIDAAERRRRAFRIYNVQLAVAEYDVLYQHVGLGSSGR